MRLSFTRNAYDHLITHARSSLVNEICGVVVGRIISNKQPKVQVEAIIQGDEAQEERIQVTFTQETWDTIHQEMETSYPDLHIVGWYHTHPGFGVEFSDMDMFVQHNFFPKLHQIAFLTDPLSGDVSICFTSAPNESILLNSFWVDDAEIACHSGVKQSDVSLENQLFEVMLRIERLTTKTSDDEDAQIISKDVELNIENILVKTSWIPKNKLFSDIDLSFYDEAEDSDELENTCAGSKLLKLAEQPFTLAELHRSSKLQPSLALGRLLALHKKAFLAEANSTWEKADFFWKEFYHFWNESFNDTELWDGISFEQPHLIGDVHHRAELRMHVLNEIVVATHAFFYNRRILHIDELTKKDRAFVHAEYLQKLLRFYKEPEKVASRLVLPAALAKAHLLSKNKEYKELEKLYKASLLECPDEIVLQNALAELYFDQAQVDEIHGASKRKNRKNAKKLAKGIDVLTAFRDRYRGNSTVGFYLGQLYQQQASCLSALEAYSEALPEAQKAFALLDEAHKSTNSQVLGIKAQDYKGHVPGEELLNKGSSFFSFPVANWLYSKQNRWLKVQVVVALVLVCTTIGMSVYDSQARKARDAAYASLLAALEEYDNTGILVSSEQFLSAKPFNQLDERLEEVKAQYSQAFVQWFAALPDSVDVNNHPYFTRYTALMSLSDKSSGTEQ